MNCMTPDFAAQQTAECPFVEVLTCFETGDVIGHRFGGNLPGPNALIAGDANLITALTERLGNLPTWPWMWGKLFLVQLDGFHCRDLSQARRDLFDVVLDEQILIPMRDDAHSQDEAVNSAYWTTLRLCQSLGMIEGRGVQAS